MNDLQVYLPALVLLGCAATQSSETDASTSCSFGFCPESTGSIEELRIATGVRDAISPVWAKFGDVDGDGLLDLVVTSSGGVGADLLLPTKLTTRRGDGRGGFRDALGPFDFTHGSLEPVTGKFDSDGRADVLMGGTVGVSGVDGGLQQLVGMAFLNRFYFWGHVNDDADIDFVAIGESVLTGLGRGDGTFEPVVESHQNVLYLSDAKVTDVDGDGATDLIGLFTPNATDHEGTASPETIVRLLRGDGLGHFGPTEDLVIEEGVLHFDVADFDGDGKRDLVLAKLRGAIEVLPRGPDGWQAATEMAREDRTLYPTFHGDPLVVADVNGDGAADIVSAIRFGDHPEQLVALLGDGNGQFEVSKLFASDLPPIYPYVLSAGDVNADGRDDILAVDSEFKGSISLWISR